MARKCSDTVSALASNASELDMSVDAHIHNHLFTPYPPQLFYNDPLDGIHSDALGVAIAVPLRLPLFRPAVSGLTFCALA
jgi:hypothetical protein